VEHAGRVGGISRFTENVIVKRHGGVRAQDHMWRGRFFGQDSLKDGFRFLARQPSHVCDRVFVYVRIFGNPGGAHAKRESCLGK
jgi:hypothetical protein